MPALFNRVVIVGVGLIGSSIGLNLVKKKLAREVIGVGRNPKNLQMAVKREAVHRFVGSAKSLPLLESLSEDDLVILATPVRQIIETLPHLPKIPLITDVGSTKASIIKEATRRGLRFVGSHPIAGTEKSGAGAGTIHLFEKRVCLLTPSRGASSRDVNRIQKLWKLCGSRTVRLSASEHDEILSWVSHLPHAVVFALVKSVGDSVSAESIERFSLGGFKGTTRIAESPAEMWRDIFLENKKKMVKALATYRKSLDGLTHLIQSGDSAKILNYLKSVQQFRRRISPS